MRKVNIKRFQIVNNEFISLFITIGLEPKRTVFSHHTDGIQLERYNNLFYVKICKITSTINEHRMP